MAHMTIPNICFRKETKDKERQEEGTQAASPLQLLLCLLPLVPPALWRRNACCEKSSFLILQYGSTSIAEEIVISMLCFGRFSNTFNIFAVLYHTAKVEVRNCL